MGKNSKIAGIINWHITSTFYQSEPYIRNARQAKKFDTWGGNSRKILYGSPGDGELDLRGVIDENERDGNKDARSR